MSGIADYRDVVRGAAASLFGFGGRLAARVAFMVVAAQSFGPKALGILGLVAAITEITAAIGVMGLKRSLLDMLSERHEAGLEPAPRIKEAFIIALGAGFAISTLLLFVWPLVLPGQPAIWALLFFAMPASIFIDVCLTAIKYKRIVKWDVWSRSIAESWGLFLLALLFLGLGMKETGLVLAYAGSLFVAALVAAYGLLSTYPAKTLAAARANFSDIPKIVRQSVPVGITDMGIMALRRIDLIVLSIFVGPTATGLYFMVQQLVTIQQRLAGLFEPMLSPVIARLHNQLNAKRIRANMIGICRWIFIIQLVIAVPMVVFGDYLLGLFNAAFITGGLVLTIILVAEVIDGTFISTETPLVFAKPKIPPTLLVFTLIIEIALIALLSYLYGVEGAAVGFLIAVCFLNLGRLWSLSKHLKINVINMSYILPTVFALLMLASLLAIRHFVSPEQGWLIIAGVVVNLTVFALMIKVFALTKSDKILFRVLGQGRSRRTSRVPVKIES
ncbi:MAG: oligosaccharide flippase family protein [Hyphomonadaceae bacterium]|nr:oligosaccharide flippase family protein [Hyphomonadaceae bacterium]